MDNPHPRRSRSRSRPRPRCALAVVVLLAGALGGCSANAGALVALDDGQATVCAPADAQGRAVFGVSTVQNRSGAAIDVVSARLVQPDDMELLGLELRSTDDQDAQVVGMDYDRYGPLSIRLPEALAAGDARTTLVGVGVPPDSGGAAASLELSYRADHGFNGTAVTRVAMVVVPFGEVCRMAEIG